MYEIRIAGPANLMAVAEPKNNPTPIAAPKDMRVICRCSSPRCNC